MYIERSIETEVNRRINDGKVIVLFGARQTGKTTLVRHTMICEKITSLSEKYFILLLEKDGKKDAGTLALFLARGICSAALRDDIEYYQTNKDSILRTAKKMLEIETKEYVAKKREMPSFLL